MFELCGGALWCQTSVSEGWGPTSAQRGGGDGAGLLAPPQSRVGLQVDGVGGGSFQVVELVSEGGFTDGLLQLCAVRL